MKSWPGRRALGSPGEVMGTQGPASRPPPAAPDNYIPFSGPKIVRDHIISHSCPGKTHRNARPLSTATRGRPPGAQSDTYNPSPAPRQPLDAVIIGRFYRGRQFGLATISAY
ncbi:hypothetical protein E2C01_042612 [Portunus trituberculatus]|uniref:Uncharacterized protein n=1 Tax=Portunus trituberculatus TaxID=210409 RepID=A0A5B7FTW6_PORTR|nr:hypothetical protein [Portunus trituberculatus]